MTDQNIQSSGSDTAVSDAGAASTRRSLLARHVKTIAVVAAGALLAKASPAKAVGNPVCFMKGTKIRTAEGERNIETLSVGDLLPTVFGGLRPIKHIVRIRRTRADASRPWSIEARPVRIMKSALAPNVPHADLFVTRAHAVLIDGVLVAAGSLINGTTIASYDAEEFNELEFFHIKLETHDAIFAEGAACECFFGDEENVSDGTERPGKGVTAIGKDAYCAPIYGHCTRSEISWRARSAMSRWLGPHKVGEIVERLEDRAREVYVEA
jgi:hypothetical protein